MTSKNNNLATLKTIVFVQIVPGLAITFVSALSLPMLMMPLLLKSGLSSTTPNSLAISRLMIWFPLVSIGVAAALSIAKDIGFFVWSRRKLYASFRDQAARSLSPFRSVTPPLVPPPIAAPPVIRPGNDMTFLPIVARELRIAARRRSTYWVRSGAALVIMVIGTWFFLVNEQRPPHEIAVVLFSILTGGAVLYCLFCGVRSTADCLSEEKREGTLGLLFLTDLKGYDVVFGKLAATSLNGFYGVLAVVPMLALPLLDGRRHARRILAHGAGGRQHPVLLPRAGHVRLGDVPFRAQGHGDDAGAHSAA